MSEKVKDTQARKYIVTLNNPEKHGFNHAVISEKLQKLKSIIYFCMADEISETGTFHTHLYAAFKSPVRFSTIKKMFPSAHIENAHGSSAQNRAYILKEGEEHADKAHTSVAGTFEEWGTLPADVGQGFRSDLDMAYQLIKDGATINEIIEAIPEMIRHINHLEKVRQMVLEEDNREIFRTLSVTYIHGATATGKTRYVMEKEGYSAVFRVTDYKNPFDSYKDENIILFDEFNSSIRLNDMLNFLDGYPLELPCRYANKRALYTVVYIVSNLPLEKQYKAIQREHGEMWAAFLRRIHHIIEFTGNGEYVKRDISEYHQLKIAFENCDEDYPFFE